MLDTLKFVQGAVSKKSLLPALSAYRIHNNSITAYNGELAIGSPIEIDGGFLPKAQPFFKAIQQCASETSLTLTDAGNLSVRSGAFRATIPCLPSGDAIEIEPEGDSHIFNGEGLLKALQTVLPFIGNDASRPWSNGVLFKDQCLTATTNALLVQVWVPDLQMPTLNLPMQAAREVVRVGEAPKSMLFADRSATFLYENDRWIKSHLLSTKWPNLDSVLQPREGEMADAPPAGFFDGLRAIADFADPTYKSVYFRDNGLHTTQTGNDGASYTFDEPFTHKGCYNIEQLLKLDGIVDAIDFAAYPEKSVFYGPGNIRGFLVGMRA